MTTDAHKLNLPYVQIKLSWSEHWQTKQHLEVESFETALNPAMPIAGLSWRAGRIAAGAAGTIEYEDYDPLLETLIGYYIRIMRPPTQAEIEEEATAAKPQPVWYGVIDAIPADLSGSAAVADDEQPNCRGLEVLLERSAIDHSVTTAGDIDTVLPFNFWNAKADSLTGNRSSAKESGPSGEESYVFSETDGEIWTAADVAEYLLAQFAPLTLEITLEGRTENLAQFKQSFGPFRNVREGLNQLISRQRGHAWRIAVALNDAPTGDGSEEVMVYVYSCFDEEVTAGGIKLEPAATSAEIDGDNDMVEGVKILHSSEHQFDKVIVRGSPLVLIGTQSFTDSTLAAAWSSASETAYENADDRARTAEKFRHVFTTYRVVAANLPAGPAIDASGNIDESTSPIQWTLGKRLLREIPLLTNADDSDAPTEFRPPMVIGKYPAGGTEYVLLDRLYDATNKKIPNIGSCLLDGEMGIRVLAYPQHLMGLNHFGGASKARSPELDYDELLVTAAWASNECLQVEVEIENDTTGEVLRTLLIEVPQFQAWYRLANTVTDVQDSALVRPADAETLRNDRDKLAVIAAMAKAWYSRQRTACSVSWYNLVYDFDVGYLLSRVTTDAGDVEVNTTISRIHYDCRNGTTLLQTDFAELDFLAPVRQGGGRGGGMRIPALAAGRVGDEPANLPVRHAAAGDAAGGVFPVLVTKDNGVAGSDSTECTYTYTVKALDDSTTLRKNNDGDNATGMTPEVPRLHYVGYWYAGETRTAPAVATSRYGLAAYDSDGDMHLLICYGEIGMDNPC